MASRGWSSLFRESRRRGHRDFASRGDPPCRRTAADGEDCLSRVSAKPEDTVLETYEQSPERPGGDARNEPATPDGPLPERERTAPD